MDASSACPVAEASATIQGTVTDVTWTETTDGTVTEQFAAPRDADLEDETVFDYGHRRVYEFDRETDERCLCEVVRATVGPVTSVHARDGRLHVTVHAGDVDRLRGLIATLRERFGSVSVEYLVESRGDGDDSDLVPVDVGRLTDRQREVLETAYGMGYFAYPRGANASEVATELGIEPSTFAEHLAVAQSKLLAELLEGRR